MKRTSRHDQGEIRAAVKRIGSPISPYAWIGLCDALTSDLYSFGLDETAHMTLRDVLELHDVDDVLDTLQNDKYQNQQMNQFVALMSEAKHRDCTPTDRLPNRVSFGRFHQLDYIVYFRIAAQVWHRMSDKTRLDFCTAWLDGRTERTAVPRRPPEYPRGHQFPGMEFPAYIDNTPNDQGST